MKKLFTVFRIFGNQFKTNILLPNLFLVACGILAYFMLYIGTFNLKRTIVRRKENKNYVTTVCTRV